MCSVTLLASLMALMNSAMKKKIDMFVTDSRIVPASAIVSTFCPSRDCQRKLGFLKDGAY